jgi:hypothetical protein
MNRLAMKAARITAIELFAFFIDRVPWGGAVGGRGKAILSPKRAPVNDGAGGDPIDSG